MTETARSRRQNRRASKPQPRRWGWWVGGLVVLAVIATLYFSGFRPGTGSAESTSSVQGTTSGGKSQDDPRINLIAGQIAPDFSLPRVDGGGTWSLSSSRGTSNVLLYFQEGSMCPPCWQQLRDLKRDGAKLQALNVQLVTITVDPIDVLKQTTAREQVSDMVVLTDTNLAVSRTYQMLFTGMMGGTTPGHSFVLVDPQGKILWRRDFKEMYVNDATILDPVAKALGK